MRFLLRDPPRPFELPRLLSLGASVEESLSTRLDSVRAPDLLCDCDREERRDFEDAPFFDFDEELRERLLLLRDFESFWGIQPLILSLDP